MAKKLDDLTKKWTEYAAENLVGRKIVACRYLTKEEMEGLGWYERCIVLQLDDGSVIYPSQDDEGNGPGALFGNTKDGDAITCPVLR